jgi:flagellar M-ring protein FliF
MASTISVLGNQLSEIWRHFGINQKVSTIMGLAVTAALIGGLLYWSSRPNYRLLYSGMTLEDAAAAREKIEDQNIPVVLKDSGTSIYVPAAEVYKCRLLLASEGILKGSSTGFELFEQPKFGLTDFAQKVNYQRALQGELERTISAMEGIASARVILVLPKEKLFASEAEKKASASILVNVSGGGALTPSQVASITRFVGSAVAGLSPSAITITDQNGRLLSKYSDPADSQFEAADSQLEAQHNLENALMRKAQAMLDKALGAGNSIVSVTADMDFSKVEKRSEKYDAEGRVVVNETISSQSSSAPNPVAAAAATTTVRVGQAGAAAPAVAMSNTKQENIKTEYKVPLDVEHLVQSGARIRGVSVSVCVAKRGETARGPEELKTIENMISNAVGLSMNGERADSIEVVEMDFPAPPEQPAPGFLQSLPISLPDIGKGVAAVAILLMIFIGSRKMVTRLSVETEEVGLPVAALAGSPGGARENGGMPAPESIESGLDYVNSLAEQDPRAIAAWITNVTKSS